MANTQWLCVISNVWWDIVKKYQKETLTQQEQHIYKVCGERLYGAKLPVPSFVPKMGMTSGLLQAFSEPQLALKSDKLMWINIVNCQPWELQIGEVRREGDQMIKYANVS